MRPSPHHDPSASGIPTSSQNAPAYIGWRTYAYGPVSMTCWPSSTRILEAAKLLTLMTKNIKRNESTMMTSPRSDTHSATGDQPKRWSSAGKIISAKNDTNTSDAISFPGPILFVLRPRLQPALQQGFVVNREIDGEAYGRGGEGGQENPALPIMERPSRPENESNKKKSAKYPLQGGLLIERIHFKTVPPRRPTSTPTSYHHNLQCLGSKDSNVARPALMR